MKWEVHPPGAKRTSNPLRRLKSKAVTSGRKSRKRRKLVTLLHDIHIELLLTLSRTAMLDGRVDAEPLARCRWHILRAREELEEMDRRLSRPQPPNRKV